MAQRASAVVQAAVDCRAMAKMMNCCRSGANCRHRWGAKGRRNVVSCELLENPGSMHKKIRRMMSKENIYNREPSLPRSTTHKEKTHEVQQSMIH